MKPIWLFFSLLAHLGTTILFYFQSKPATPKAQIVAPLSQKQLDKLLKDYEDRLVSTDPKLKAKQPPKTKEKIYLGKQNQQAEKNTKAKKDDKFINGDGKEFGSAPKSITTKGKYTAPQGKGISASDDFIIGAEIGPMTILNTQEFKYSSYYERIKEIVVENWRPLIRKAIKLVKSDENKYGVLDIGFKITKLEIYLNSKGEITGIKVVQSSGFDSFDQAAQKAFRKSAPFAFPPTELVKNNRFLIRWDFCVSVEAAGLVKFNTGSVK